MHVTEHRQQSTKQEINIAGSKEQAINRCRTSWVPQLPSTESDYQPPALSIVQPSALSTVQPSALSTVQPSALSTVQPSALSTVVSLLPFCTKQVSQHTCNA